jgi:uncharacterized RDD family membrane protein YckC
LEGQTAIPPTDPTAVPALHHAGFWIRFAAGIVDLTILAVSFAVFVSFLSVAMGIAKAFVDLRPGIPPSQILAQFGPRFLFLCLCFFAVTGWLYFAILESSSWHATLGKRLFGLYLADVHGNPIDFWRASLRFFGGRLLLHVPVLGFYYFLADCLCVGLLPSKRAIHDILAGCLVLQESLDSALIRWRSPNPQRPSS